MFFNSFLLKETFSSIKNSFSTTRCKDLSDTLWKRRVKWVEGQAIRVPAGSRVLDVGAGSCSYKPFFKNCDYVAQDFAQTPDMTYGEIDVISDITSIPLKNESFDVVLCTEVFEHVSHPEKALQEITRLLKPGGKLIFSAPLGSGQHQQPYHFYGGYTRFWYEKFFPENGLRIKTLRPNGGLFGHTAEQLWRSQPIVMEYFSNRGFMGRTIGSCVQIFIYNLPTVFLWKFEERKVVEDFTVCFFVTAIKKGDSK
jgi:SAM-dependent methyltransferase